MVRIKGTASPLPREIAEAIRLTPRLMNQLAVPLDREFGRLARERFATEGASGGARWAPLSPEYAKRKAGLRRRDLRQARQWRGFGLRRGPTIAGRTILVLGGSLRASLAQPTAPGHVREVSGTKIALGTSVPWGIYHYRGRPPLPRRNPIQHTPTQALGYQRIIADEFRKRVQAVMRARARYAA